MANIPIYNHNTLFISGSTPFGFYDNDISFRNDANKVTTWCAQRLGYPIHDVELQPIQFHTAFEEAITVYGNEIYQWKIRENYINFEGSANNININNQLITPTLSNIIRISKTYGSEAGTGGTVTWRTGMIPVTASISTYDLNAWASSSLQSNDTIEIKRIFHNAPPAIVRYFDPYAGTGTGIQSLMESFGFGSQSPGINFMLMPMNFDLMKMQAIELNDEIRKSAYGFELINNQLRLFPIPNKPYDLYFQYIKTKDRDSIAQETSSNIITNISEVPYQNPTYSGINSIGKQWIYQYTLALAKEMLGYVRGKYSTIPIPGSETTLNQDALLTDAREEKRQLLEQLRLALDDSSRSKQLEKKSLESDYVSKMLNNIPLPFYIF